VPTPGLPTLPRSAETYSAEQRTEIQAALAALMRSWRRMSDDFDASWPILAPQMIQVIDLAQERVATGALAYIPAVLTETGQRLQDPAYDVDPNALVGSAGDGRPTETLLYGGVIRAKQTIAEGATATEALAAGGQFLTMAMGTVLSDTGRTAEKMAGHARRVAWYTRMLSPPSCGRCLILAGEQTTAKTAFRRHPGCDCRNIPVAEAVADDLTVNPAEYLESLDDAGLARVLGSKANARAYRDGADPQQIINAYREKAGPAQIFNRRIQYTYEGTTRRGLAYRAMRAADLTGGSSKQGGRYRRSNNVRLMPETIYARARSRAEALQLLREYGWIRPTQPGFTIVDGIARRVR